MRRVVMVGLIAFVALGLAVSGQDVKRFSGWSSPVNLGSTINTAFGDSCVSVSKNGLSLFFSSNRQSPGTTNRDLYVANRPNTDADWGAPQRLPVVNSSVWDSCPALSLDEHRLYFTSQRQPNCGPAGTADIWVTRRQDRRDDLGWEEPVNLGCETDGYINTAGNDLTPTFFEDEAGNEVMYLSSMVAGTSAHYESVMRPDGTFGPATPVHELNADYDQGITVRRDGLEVFFLSIRPGGSGNANSLDVWTSTRTSTAVPWTTPIFVPAFGVPAFAQGRISLSFDGTQLYFTSSRPGGFGAADLYVATRERVRGGK